MKKSFNFNRVGCRDEEKEAKRRLPSPIPSNIPAAENIVLPKSIEYEIYSTNIRKRTERPRVTAE